MALLDYIIIWFVIDDLYPFSCRSTSIELVFLSFIQDQPKTIGLGLWCLTPLSTLFQLYRGGKFYWWIKPPTCCRNMANFITYICTVVSSTPRHEREIRIHNFSGDRH